MKKSLIFEIVAVIAIIALAFAVRLYKIDNPVADWHSWRQADTASVTRTFSQRGIDFFKPRYHDLSSTPSGKENPEGYRMVEVPIYNLIHLGIYRLAPGLGIDRSGRLTSVFLSLISLILLYLIVRKLSGKLPAILAAIFFAFLPFSIYYSRVILPEPLMVVFFLASFLFFIQGRLFSLPLSAVFLALALLIKPYAVFFTLPYFYLLFKKGIKPKKLLQLIIFFTLAATPLLLWRLWISQFPEGIPASGWLYNLNGIRLRPAWFRWLFAERLGKLILGYWGSLLLGLGLVISQKESWIYRLWFVGILAYFVIFAGGNVTHDYYQAITIPFICILLAFGANFLIKPPKEFSKVISYLLLAAAPLLMLAFSWYEIKGYYQINNPVIIEAGHAADRILPPDAKVIAPYNGDTAFLYQTNRSGWPIGKTIDDKIKNGATAYVSVVNDEETAFLSAKYITLEKTDRYIIIDLTTYK